MAKVTLKNGADPLEVTEELKRIGITKGQMLPNGQMVVYINQRTYMCRLYPKLIPLYQEDRRFWKNVRKRTRNGEDVPQSEIQAHADYFKKMYNQIINQHEKEEENNPLLHA